MNPTAAFIWTFRAEAQLAELYAAHFRISRTQADTDIGAVLGDVSRLGPYAAELKTESADVDQEVSQVLVQIGETSFDIRIQTSDLHEELYPRLQHLKVAGPAVHSFVANEWGGAVHLYKDGVHFATEPMVVGIRARLLQELTRMAAPSREFGAILHAGAVGGIEECLILAGPSFAGKSTLCRALMQSGLLCYSDDSVCLTASDFHVAGMPFPLSLREPVRWMPSNLNGTSPTVKPKAMIFVKYLRSASSTELAPITDTFETLLQLQLGGFWVTHSQSAIKDFLHFLSRLPSYQLIYSDLAEARAKLCALLLE